MISFRSPDAAPSRAERYLQLVVALLHFVLAGMLVYFRLGPAARVLEQLRGRMDVPEWLPLGMSVGTLAVAGFVAFRGLGSLRRFRAMSSPGAPPEA